MTWHARVILFTPQPHFSFEHEKGQHQRCICDELINGSFVGAKLRIGNVINRAWNEQMEALRVVGAN